MKTPDPTAEFARILSQVKAAEFERGWREAMQAIQNAASELIERAQVASLGAALSDGAARAPGVSEALPAFLRAAH